VLNGTMDLTRLTRKRGVKVPPGFPCSVEDCSLAVGEMVGHGSVKSAARMNNAVVMFMDSVDKANMVVEKEIVVNETFVPVLPLATPATRVTVSNVPPFIRDEMLTRELSRHGMVVSPINKMSSGLKSPLLRHVVSHTRTLYMILNKKNEDLNVVFKLRVDGFDYVVFVNSDSTKCYRCGREGHLSRTCPEKTSTGHSQGGQARQEGTVGVQQLVERGTDGVNEDTGGAQQVGRASDGANEGVSGVQQVRKASDGANEGVSGAQQVGQASDGAISSRWGRRVTEPEEKDGEQRGLSGQEGVREQRDRGGWGSRSGVSLSGGTATNRYSVGRVKLFLKTTKNIKGIKLEDYFPDMEKFGRTAREAASKRGSSRYTQQEVFRLGEIVQKINSGNERAAGD
uniref:CCHC-type domain-containing protein n=1 Tax=Gasterosteus aculeatus TaxID=69293 RepID=G3N7E2_GASAC